MSECYVVRIFRNGRLMPRSKYRLIATFEYPRILFTDWMNRGDIIYIDDIKADIRSNIYFKI